MITLKLTVQQAMALENLITMLEIMGSDLPDTYKGNIQKFIKPDPRLGGINDQLTEQLDIFNNEEYDL